MAHITPHPSFAERVREVHATWRDIERATAWHHDRTLPAQRQLLGAIREWCLEAAAVILAVYGEGMGVQLREDIETAGETPSFELIIEDAELLAAVEPAGSPADAWRVRIAVRYPDTPDWTYPRTLSRAWTRAAIQEILLSMLAAVERDRHHGPARPHALAAWAPPLPFEDLVFPPASPREPGPET